jgi:hypothetical protein
MVFVPLAPLMPAEIEFFGRYNGRFIRDGVLAATGDIDAASAGTGGSCDNDEAVAAFGLEP